MNKLISIIVPLYNTDKYFEDCIKSIINQTYKNIEIIIINDGSTDNSLNIAKKYETIDNRIKLIDKENTGVSDTRNIGIEKSKGEYIIFIDSDDWVEQNTIEEMFNCVINNNVDVARCNAKRYVSSEKYIVNKIPQNILNKKIDLGKNKSLLNYLFNRKNNINCYSPLLLMKKSVIPKFNIKLFCMEDVPFYIELLINSNSIYLIDDELYNYRYNENSSSKEYINVERNIDGIIDSLNYIIEILLKNNIANDDLIDDIYINYFNIIISKLDILIVNKKEKEITNINNRLLLNLMKKMNYHKLNNVKKIEYIFLKNKMVNTFIIFEKIKLKIK